MKVYVVMQCEEDKRVKTCASLEEANKLAEQLTANGWKATVQVGATK